MRWKNTILAACALVAVGVTSAFADQSPTFTGAQTSAETAFVTSIQADLMQRFPTAADAEKAGYLRYTNADETGAISYANQQWQSKDSRHPSQLWYDKDGNLLGADFSVLTSGSAHRPQLFGVNPGRWYEFDDHVHYVTKDPATGKMGYDLYVPAPEFTKAGGDMKHPQVATLIALHKVQSAADVQRIFDMPAIWDLIVWVKPNPNGAFAEKNPTVTP